MWSLVLILLALLQVGQQPVNNKGIKLKWRRDHGKATNIHPNWKDMKLYCEIMTRTPFLNFACQSDTAAKPHGTSKGQILGLLNDLAERKSNSMKVAAYQPLSNFTPPSTTRKPPNTKKRQEKCNESDIYIYIERERDIYIYIIDVHMNHICPDYIILPNYGHTMLWYAMHIRYIRYVTKSKTQ